MPHARPCGLWNGGMWQRVACVFVCICLFLAYLLLGFILGPGSLSVLLAQGLLLLVVQQRVVFMITYDLVLIVLQYLCQDEILQQR